MGSRAPHLLTRKVIGSQKLRAGLLTKKAERKKLKGKVRNKLTFLAFAFCPLPFAFYHSGGTVRDSHPLPYSPLVRGTQSVHEVLKINPLNQQT